MKPIERMAIKYLRRRLLVVLEGEAEKENPDRTLLNVMNSGVYLDLNMVKREALRRLIAEIKRTSPKA